MQENNRMITFFIIAFLVSILVPLILRQGLSKCSNENDKETILVSPFYSRIGALGFLIFLLLAISIYFFDEGGSILSLVFCYAFCTFGILVSIYLILSSKKFKLYLGEDKLEYTNFLGIKRVLNYSEIFKITTHHNANKIDSYKIHFANLKITIGYDMINFDSFESIITKRLKKAQNVEALSKLKSNCKTKK